MTVEQFKHDLAALISEDRNREAIDFVATKLPAVKEQMSGADRMMVADWMEGVAMALDSQAMAARETLGRVSST